MPATATADVVIRSRKKGAAVYGDVKRELGEITMRAVKFGAAAGAIAVGGIAALTAKSFASADALAKSAEKMGIGTQRLGALNHLAVQAGGSVGGMQEALVKATKRLGEFNTTGGGAAGVWIKRLNLDSRELAELKPDELFARYSDEIKGLSSRGEQLAAISALMGDESRSLIGLVQQGSEQFAAAEAEVALYGIALDGIESAKIEAANDAIFKSGERVKGIGNVIAGKVAPVVTALANRFLDTGFTAEKMGKIADRAIDGIAFGVGVVVDIFHGLRIVFGAIEIGFLELSAGIVGGFSKIERAVLIVQNIMAEAFGGETIDVEGGFMVRVEDSLRATSAHATEVLQELIASERPSKGIARALDNAREAAEKTARATAEAREHLAEINAPTFDESSKDEAATARAAQAQVKLEERLAKKLEKLELSLATEIEREQFAFEARQEIIDLALENELISEERANEVSEKLAVKHQAKLTKIDIAGMTERQKFLALTNKERAKDIFGNLEQITAGVANNNKTMFRLNQAAAIANAIIHTYEGVTLTMSKYPYPFNLVFAAAHLAAGLAQVSAIRSASFGGGTTPSLAGATPTFEGQPVGELSPAGSGSDASSNEVGRTVTIIVQGNLIGDQGLRDVLVETLGDIADDDVIIIPADSRNAEEIRQGSGGG